MDLQRNGGIYRVRKWYLSFAVGVTPHVMLLERFTSVCVLKNPVVIHITGSVHVKQICYIQNRYDVQFTKRQVHTVVKSPR